MSPHASGGPWLVTGASGFLGRHLLEAIEADPPAAPPVALVRDAAAWTAQDWVAGLPRVRALTGTLNDAPRWSRSPELAGLRGIFHLAAEVRHGPQDAAAVEHTNVEGTIAMVRLAAGLGCRLVFVSTSGTVGCFRTPGALPDETAPYCEQEVARWPYYRSKIAAERSARGLAGELGVELVIVRPPVLLGPGDHRFRSSEHVLRLLRGKVPFVIAGGMHYADVRDVAAALRRVMERDHPQPVYHLPGTVCSIAEFYGDVAALAGRRPPRVVPYPMARLAGEVAHRLGLAVLPEPRLIEMASRHWGTRSRYAELELGYRTRPGRETLKETIAWLRAHHPDLQGS